MTTIDVVEKADIEDVSTFGPGAKYVEFDGKIKHKTKDGDVAFLLQVKQKEEKDDTVVFQAIKVSLEIFREKLMAENKKLLACVHGFQVEPEDWLEECAKIQNSELFEHKVIPVIWPSVGAAGFDVSIKYDREQTIAYEAGAALAPIAELGMDSHLSLMCHSMGNRVLLSYVQHNASIDQKFENVFMVAADVWEEVFNTRVIKNTWFQPPWNYWNLWEDTGLKLTRMLKDGGKVHIASYPNDMALIGSEYWENWRRRLGRFGKKGQRDRIHKECVDKLEDFDTQLFEEEVIAADSGLKHGYYTMPSLVKYYNETMKGEVTQ